MTQEKKDAETTEIVEIDLEKVDEKPSADEVKVEKAEEAPPAKVIEPNEGIETLKAQLERERAARIAAEKHAREVSEVATKAQSEVHDSNLSLVINAIETLKQSQESLKASYRDALAAGDFERAADAQSNMATAAAKLLQLEQGKEALEQAPKPKAPPAPSSFDPVETLASQLSPRSADWIRRNPTFVTDKMAYQRMLAAHNLAVADGIAVDTDEYFDAIETTLRIKRAEPRTAADDATAEAAKVTQRRSAPPVSAPVARGTGQRPNVVRLTAAEREMASAMKMTEQEYAKAKLALQKEGKLN